MGELTARTYKYSGTTPITVKDFLKKNPLFEFETSKDFVEYDRSDACQEITVDELNNFTCTVHPKNSLFILNNYTDVELQEAKDNSIICNEYPKECNNIILDYDNLIIYPNTIIYIPISNLLMDKLSLYSDNQFLKQEEQTQQIESNIPAFNNWRDNFKVYKNIISINNNVIDIDIINQNILVWIWVKSLDKLINITPFVNNLRTSKQSIVGDFNFDISPVFDIDELLNTSNDEFINFFNLDYISELEIPITKQHIKDFFEKNLQYNDVVFIRFEQLKSDKEGDDIILKGRETLFLEKNALGSERSWDMIGLVDKVTSSFSSYNSEKKISVSGRDFTKILQEDGSYFIIRKYIADKDVSQKFIWGGDDSDTWWKRNMMTGEFNTFFSFKLKNIEDSLKFIINFLSNLGITPNNLWYALSDLRTTKYNIPDCEKQAIERLEINGIWQAIKLTVANSLKDRQIVGSSLMNPNGTLLDFFYQVCQEPFVEIITDSYTDKFDITIRQPPFTEAAIKNAANYFMDIDNTDELSIRSNQVLSYDLSFDTTYYSHYQIEPNDQFISFKEGDFQSIIPIIYFNEIAENFGNKKYMIKDSYLSKLFITGKTDNNRFTTLIDGILNDYKYLIETNVYLPFTRTGTIEIIGDRRHKRGNFVYFEPTDELFYIDGVTNNFSNNGNNINRTTTLQVSRGMVFAYINKSIKTDNNGNFIKPEFTYFDIVDTDFFIEDIKNNINNKKTTSKINMVLNKKAFDFFLKRKQFL